MLVREGLVVLHLPLQLYRSWIMQVESESNEASKVIISRSFSTDHDELTL